MLPNVPPLIRKAIGELHALILPADIVSLTFNTTGESSMLTAEGRRRFVEGTYAKLTAHYKKTFEILGGTEEILGDAQNYIEDNIKRIEKNISDLQSGSNNNNNNQSKIKLEIEEEELKGYKAAQKYLQKNTRPLYYGTIPLEIEGVRLIDMVAYYWVAAFDPEQVQESDILASKTAFVLLFNESKKDQSCPEGIFGRFAQNGAPYNPLAETFPLSEQIYYQIRIAVVAKIKTMPPKIQAGFFNFLNNRLNDCEDMNSADAENFRVGIEVLGSESNNIASNIFSELISKHPRNTHEIDILTKIADLSQKVVANLTGPDACCDGQFIEDIFFATVRSRIMQVVTQKLDIHQEKLNHNYVGLQNVLAKSIELEEGINDRQKINELLYPMREILVTTVEDEIENLKKELLELQALIDGSHEFVRDMEKMLAKSIDDLRPDLPPFFHDELALNDSTVMTMASDADSIYSKFDTVKKLSQETEVMLRPYHQKIALAIVRLAYKLCQNMILAEDLIGMIKFIGELNPENKSHIIQRIIALLIKLPANQAGRLGESLNHFMYQHENVIVDFTIIDHKEDLGFFLMAVDEILPLLDFKNSLPNPDYCNLSEWVETITAPPVYCLNNPAQWRDQVALLALLNVFQDFDESIRITAQTKEFFVWLCSLYLDPDAIHDPEYSTISIRISDLEKDKYWQQTKQRYSQRNISIEQLESLQRFYALGKHVFDIRGSLNNNRELFLQGKLSLTSSAQARNKLSSNNKEECIIFLTTANPYEAALYYYDAKIKQIRSFIIRDMQILKKSLAGYDGSGEDLERKYSENCKEKNSTSMSTPSTQVYSCNNRNAFLSSPVQVGHAQTGCNFLERIHQIKDDINKLTEILQRLGDSLSWDIDFDFAIEHKEAKSGGAKRQDVLIFPHINIANYLNDTPALAAIAGYYHVIVDNGIEQRYFEWNEKFHSELEALHLFLFDRTNTIN